MKQGTLGTLSTELAPHAQRLSSRPRIYADANVPAGLVAYMRLRLQWDVLFVVEEDTLRRAPDLKHYRLAQQLRRTLVTMDRDYLDDKRFPPDEGSGVLVINAPDEQQLTLLLERIDRALFCDDGPDPAAAGRAQAAGELGLGPRHLMTPALGLELRDSAAAAVAVDDAGARRRTGPRRIEGRLRGGSPRGGGRRGPGGWIWPAGDCGQSRTTGLRRPPSSLSSSSDTPGRSSSWV